MMGTYKMSNKKHNGKPVWANKDRSKKLFYTSGQTQKYIYFSPLSLFPDGTWMIGTPWNQTHHDYNDYRGAIKTTEQGHATVPATGWQYNGWTGWIAYGNLTVTRKILIFNPGGIPILEN